MSIPIQSILPAQNKAGVTTISLSPGNGKAATPVCGLAEVSRNPEPAFSAFGSLNQFKDAQRMALMLARSSIVPENYRRDEHIADCVIALEIANRIGASVLAVMQNLQVVQGRVGWSSQFLISCLNATKRFSPIRYQMTGRRGKDCRGCIAWAIDKSGEVLKSPEVTIRMAKEEGWYHRLGSKWKTMPELMLCYRSATLFTRLYAPEITMGIQTTEEMADRGCQVNGKVSRPVFSAKASKHVSRPQTNGQLKRKSPRTHPRTRNSTGDQGIKKAGPETSLSPPKAVTRNYDYLKALQGLIELSPHSETRALDVLHKSFQLDPRVKSLPELSEKHPDVVVWAHDHWTRLEQELAKTKEVSV